eukprot:scaffold181572_cov21-Tisochrysis_lutea.AAC.1
MMNWRLPHTLLLTHAAFIKLASVEAAHTAIKALHNSKLGGRTIIVKSAEQDCEYGELRKELGGQFAPELREQ